MIQKTVCRCVGVGLFAAGVCLLSGCDVATRRAFRGVTEQVGAKIVQRSSDDELKKMFEQANAFCPRKVDAYTTLASVEMIDSTHAEFRYQVTDQGKKMASLMDKGTMKQAAVEQLKGNPMAVAIAERDLSIHHIYEDKSGNHVLSYVINKAALDGDLDPGGDQKSNPFGVSTVNSDASQSVTPSRYRGIKPQPRKNPAGVQENPYF